MLSYWLSPSRHAFWRDERPFRSCIQYRKHCDCISLWCFVIRFRVAVSTAEFLTLAMGPKKVSDIEGKKRMLSLETKMEMIKKHEWPSLAQM